MSTRSTDGFTVLEVLVAILVLGVGVMALAGTAGMATRQIGRGKMVTIASQTATTRLDGLRRIAAIRNASGQPCLNGNFVGGTDTNATYGIREIWTVSAAATGLPRTVTDSVRYPRAGGTSGFKVTTIIGCK